MTEREGVEAVGTVYGVLKYGWVLSSGITLLPACLIVLAGEIARIRSALYYILGGGASVAAIPLLARLGPSASDGGASILSWQVFATAGFFGGFIYWLVAGRRA
jgi:tetrahydromethanopterin S-methyltransferase subunit B